MLQGVLATLPMFVCAFWLIALLADKYHFDRAKKMLSIFMFSAFILYLCHAVFFYEYQKLYLKLDGIYTCCSLSVYPLYYLYIRRLTIRENYKWIHLLVLLPSLLMGSFTYLLYLLMPDGEPEIFVDQVLYRANFHHNFSLAGMLQLWRVRLFTVVFIVQIFPVFYYGLKHIRYYNSLLAQYYSDMGRKELSPVRGMLYFFVAISFLSVLSGILGRSFFRDTPWTLAIPSISFSALLFCGGLVGFRQDFTIVDFARDLNKEPEAERRVHAEEISDVKMSLLKNRLQFLLIDQHLYTKKDLRITDLARRLGSNRAYVSRVINQQFDTNFSDLINSYRLEHAKKLLLETEYPVSMDEIAECSGFSSQSTFYRIFQHQMKMSPKAWRKRQRLVRA